ncbi:MAG: relaxase/mobilization nuclease domain-containing protein [Bacteroidota bacterium]
MIIKSTSRKDVDFAQIIAYLHKEGERMERAAITYVHNIDALPDDLEGMVQALEDNDRYRRKRKNGVGFYHDIISFSPKDSATIRQQPWLLRDLIEQYIRLRCPHGLAVARVHLEEDHIHIHVVVSANERESSKSTRISKADFERIKAELQTYRAQHYPILEHSYQHYASQQSFETDKPTAIAVYLDKIGRKQTKKAALRQHLLDAIIQAQDANDLEAQLKASSIQLYQRNGQWGGVVQDNRKYRFTTLLQMDKELSIRQQQYYLQKLAHLEQGVAIARIDSKIFKHFTQVDQRRIVADVQRLERNRPVLGRDSHQERHRGI